MPKSAAEKARLRLLCDFFDLDVVPAQYTYFMNRNETQETELQQKQALEDKLSVLEMALEASGGPFLMGQQFTLADVHVLPFYMRMVASLDHFKGSIAFKISFSLRSNLNK
jgi:glutathione S-transferase